MAAAVHAGRLLLDQDDPAQSVPGGGMLAGIGFVSGVRCMVVASDSGIEAGAIQEKGLDKMLRVQEIALQNKLPFIHLVESAGANLMRYRVEGFVMGGALFRNLARLSAAGLPVITVQHGSGTAGGAYMPGLSDVVIMVRGRSRAFLAGPPLLKAATGEIATEEELGGAEMHPVSRGWASISRRTTAMPWAWHAPWCLSYLYGKRLKRLMHMQRLLLIQEFSSRVTTPMSSGVDAGAPPRAGGYA
jgi:acetyl-CoA carboxylase carboxyltransferase component